MFYHQNEAELILVMLQGTEQGWEGAGEQPWGILLYSSGCSGVCTFNLMRNLLQAPAVQGGGLVSTALLP